MFLFILSVKTSFGFFQDVSYPKHSHNFPFSIKLLLDFPKVKLSFSISVINKKLLKKHSACFSRNPFFN